MAQIDGMTYVENPTGGEDAQGHCPDPESPAFGKGSDHEDEHGHHHVKKSVLGKVKEVAKKLKHSLSKKRHGHDTIDDDGHFTREWGAGLGEHGGNDKHSEYHGAPMHVPESAPAASHKQPATLQTVTAGREKTMEVPHDGQPKSLDHLDSFKEGDLQGQLGPAPPVAVADYPAPEAKDIPLDPAAAAAAAGNGGNKTLTETVSEMFAPAYAVVSDTTRKITTKIQSPGPWSQEREVMAKQVWDKGVSMKEYLLRKLEPGENEKALSDVITEAMSPRKKDAGGGEAGVVEKVKVAVTSLLGMEMPAVGQPEPGSEIPWENSVSKDGRPVVLPSKCLSLPVSTGPQVIRVSTKSHPVSLPSTPHLAQTSTPAHPNQGSTKSHSVSLPSTPHRAPTYTPAQPNLLYNTPAAGIIEEEHSNGRMLQAYLN